LKTLIYWRHSVKGSGNHSADIMQAGLDATAATVAKVHQSNGWMVNHFFAGPLKRTWQTMVAIMLQLLQSGYSFDRHYFLHEEIDEVGTQGLFDLWTRDAGVKFGAGRTNFQALQQDLKHDYFPLALEGALGGVMKMMAIMSDGETGLAVGHSPIIELAAHAAGLDMANAPQLMENEFIVFEQHDDGHITASYPS